MPSKKPILFDDHISTDETEIQYILDTRVGKKTYTKSINNTQVMFN